MEKRGVSIPLFTGMLGLLKKAHKARKELDVLELEAIRARLAEIEVIYEGSAPVIERDGAHCFSISLTPEEWIVSEDVGTSSRTIWCVLMGLFQRKIVGPEKLRCQGRYDVPHDPSDFGRCHRLFKHIPAWRGRLNEVALVFPKWEPFVGAWSVMETLYERDLKSGKSDELWNMMRKLEDEGQKLEEKIP
jgi:hypothetical protein